MTTAAAAAAPPKFKRSAKNYLLDTRFQLKYTSYIVGVTMVVSCALGVLLWRQTVKTVEIGNEAVQVGTDANKAGQEAVSQSDSLNAKLEMDAMKGYGDDPVLVATIKDANKEQTDSIKKRAAQLQASQTKLEAQRQALTNQQTLLMVTLVGALLALVVFVGMAGIVVTHKVAGPIFKMKRLLKDVGDGKLVLQGRLRKGDELHDFFEVFAQMVENLRKRQEIEISTLDGAIAVAKEGGASDELVGKLSNLRAAMQAELEAK